MDFFAAYSHTAGTYLRFHNLAVALRRRGHAIRVLTADLDPRSSSRSEIRDGVPYDIVHGSRAMRLFGGTSHPWTAWRRARRGLRRADVAHAFQPALISSAAWRRAARLARLACYDWDDLYEGGLLADRPASPAGWWERAVMIRLERRLPRAAGLVTAGTDDLARRARALGAGRVVTVPNGFWPAPPPSRADARRALGLEPGAIYAGFMGRTLRELSWCTGAMASVAAEHPRLRLALCGMDAAAVPAVPEPARGRIVYLGQLTPERARLFGAALDIGLLPLEDTAWNRSRFPIKFAEYLGAGAPVLVSRVGDWRDPYTSLAGVLDAGTGREAWDAAFADAVTRAAADTLPAVDAAGARRLLDWNVIAEGLERAYLDALAEGGR